MKWENKSFSSRQSIIYSSLTIAAFLLIGKQRNRKFSSTPKSFNFLSRTVNPFEDSNFSNFYPKTSSPLFCFYLVLRTPTTTYMEPTSASFESELWHFYIPILAPITSFFLLQFFGYVFQLRSLWRQSCYHISFCLPSSWHRMRGLSNILQWRHTNQQKKKVMWIFRVLQSILSHSGFMSLEGNPSVIDRYLVAIYSTVLISFPAWKTCIFPGGLSRCLSPPCLPSVPCASGGILLEGPMSSSMWRISCLCSSTDAEIPLSPQSHVSPTLMLISLHLYGLFFFLTFFLNLSSLGNHGLSL